MRMNKREKGAQKEEQVCACLLSKGVKIVERNFRNRQGEIDIIGYDGCCLYTSDAADDLRGVFLRFFVGFLD